MGNVGEGSDQSVQENSSFCPQVTAGLSFQKAARAPVLAWELGELLSAALSPWRWGSLKGEHFGLAATHACFAGTDGRPHAGPCLLFGEMALFQCGSQQANSIQNWPQEQWLFLWERLQNAPFLLPEALAVTYCGLLKGREQAGVFTCFQAHGRCSIQI